MPWVRSNRGGIASSINVTEHDGTARACSESSAWSILPCGMQEPDQSGMYVSGHWRGLRKLTDSRIHTHTQTHTCTLTFHSYPFSSTRSLLLMLRLPARIGQGMLGVRSWNIMLFTATCVTIGQRKQLLSDTTLCM